MTYIKNMRKKRLSVINDCHEHDLSWYPVLSNLVSYKHKAWRLFGDCLCQKLLLFCCTCQSYLSL